MFVTIKSLDNLRARNIFIRKAEDGPILRMCLIPGWKPRDTL